jgi:hypothetical protein
MAGTGDAICPASQRQAPNNATWTYPHIGLAPIGNDRGICDSNDIPPGHATGWLDEGATPNGRRFFNNLHWAFSDCPPKRDAGNAACFGGQSVPGPANRNRGTYVATLGEYT